MPGAACVAAAHRAVVVGKVHCLVVVVVIVPGVVAGFIVGVVEADVRLGPLLLQLLLPLLLQLLVPLGPAARVVAAGGSRVGLLSSGPASLTGGGRRTRRLRGRP